MKTQKISIDTTKRGFAAMWESGGGLTSGGSATIIAGRNGEARRPIYVPRGGHLACGSHALIGVDRGFYVVRAGVSRGTRSSASVSRIVGVSVKDINGEKWEATAELEEVNTFSEGEWDTPLDPKLVPAVEAAFNKAGSFHCRSAYFVDTSAKPDVSEAEKVRRDAETQRQDAERAKLRQSKADADALAKAQAEAASKTAKEAGLGSRRRISTSWLSGTSPQSSARPRSRGAGRPSSTRKRPSLTSSGTSCDSRPRESSRNASAWRAKRSSRSSRPSGPEPRRSVSR